MRNGVKPKSRSPVRCWKMDPAGETLFWPSSRSCILYSQPQDTASDIHPAILDVL